MTILETLIQLRNDLKIWTANNLRVKVDKEDGKGLSSNDFTNEEKEKLKGIAEDANAYVLPTATADTLGGVKVGAGLSITNGVLSTNGGGVADAVEWVNVQNKPTTVSGYGIADAYTKEEVDNKLPNLEGYAKTEDIPEALADLTDDTTHRTVTDAEKESWNNKSEFSGSYNDLTDKPIVDWDIADESLPGAIKNKPFGYISTIIVDQEEWLFSEPAEGANVLLSYFSPDNFVNGEAYDVYLDNELLWQSIEWPFNDTTADGIISI